MMRCGRSDDTDCDRTAVFIYALMLTTARRLCARISSAAITRLAAA